MAGEALRALSGTKADSTAARVLGVDADLAGLDRSTAGSSGSGGRGRGGSAGGRGSSSRRGSSGGSDNRGGGHNNGGSWGRGRSGSLGGGRSRGGGGSGGDRGSTAGTTHREVNARLIGLVDRTRVPPPLNNASTSSRALAPEVRERDAEVSLVLLERPRNARIVCERDQRRADDRVGRSVDDRDVGSSGVGSADISDDRENLAGGVGLDVGGAHIRELKALAQEKVARVRIEPSLLVLDERLDVSSIVRVDVVEDLFAAVGTVRSSGLADGRRGNDTVSDDLADEGSNERNGSELVKHVG